jgi:enamine deaminase RidA (YjgF/YER057c/UK114 family)
LTRQNASMPIERYFTGTTFEPRVGYCRAVRVGDRILVAGTLGLTGEGAPAGDAYAQAVAALTRIVGAIEELGGRASDVVRTRMFAIDPQGDWEAFADAHREAFGEHPPVATMVGTSALAVDGCLIEIEAEADLGGR